MKYFRFFALAILSFFIVNSAFTQTAKPEKAEFSASSTLRSSATFAEVILRRTELESTLEEMLVSYTEEFPKIKETRYELEALRKDIAKLNSVKPEETSKLTSALGKLLVRKAAVEADYWALSNRFDTEHPEVKRARKKFEIFEKAVREIL